MLYLFFNPFIKLTIYFSHDCFRHVSNMTKTLTVMIRAKSDGGINVTASRWGVGGRREGMQVTPTSPTGFLTDGYP